MVSGELKEGLTYSGSRSESHVFHVEDNHQRLRPQTETSSNIITQSVESTIPILEVLPIINQSEGQHNYSRIQELNTDEASYLIKQLSIRGIEPSIQLLAILSDNNIFKGQPLNTIEERIGYAISFSYDKILSQYSAMGYADHLLSTSVIPYLYPDQPGLKIYSEYLKAKYQMSDEQVSRLERTHMADFDNIGYVDQQAADIVKSPLINGEVPKPKGYFYDPYKIIEFSDGNGRQQKFRIMWGAGDQDHYVLVSRSNSAVNISVEKGYVDQFATMTRGEKIRSYVRRIEKIISDTVFNAQLFAVMSLQFGGIHPERIEGKWYWVMEPWARFKDDPVQGSSWGAYYGTDNRYYKYFKDLKKQGKKIIVPEDLGNQAPLMFVNGLSLVAADRYRIHGARDAKISIVIYPTNDPSALHD